MSKSPSKAGSILKSGVAGLKKEFTDNNRRGSFVQNRENSKDIPDINSTSGSIVEQKKQRIFDKVFDLLLIDCEKTFVPLIHPATVNLRHLPF
jgi:hypothetical protein